MKKKIFVVFLCMSSILIMLSSCNRGKNSNGSILSTMDVYGFGAVSTVRLIENDALDNLEKKQKTTQSMSPYQEEDLENEAKFQAKKFNEYFTALDNFMGEEIVTTSTEKNSDEGFPYETKLIIKSKSFNGEDVLHIMYYTEKLIQTEQEDYEIEKKYKLLGVMIMDGQEYSMEGERTIEEEEDETENEIKIRAYADINDKGSYIEMSQEQSIENNETEIEYVYSIYSKGELIEETAIEFETEKEGEKEEIEYELEFRKGPAKGKYVIEREQENAKVQIKVKYHIDEKKGEFFLALSNEGKYEYFFKDGTILSF